MQVPTARSSSEIAVRFDANVTGLPWHFRPAQDEVRVKLGETTVVHFIAENTSNSATAGRATFNVLPETAGYYFNKIECFCFTNQELKPGERVEMPVQFFVSPDFADDRDLERDARDHACPIRSSRPPERDNRSRGRKGTQPAKACRTQPRRAAGGRFGRAGRHHG